jgi:thiol-disulfide isomerase/thioredoxin
MPFCDRLGPIVRFLSFALFFYASLVNDVRSLVVRQDFASAERLVRSYQSAAGKNSELAAAESWLARGFLEAGQLDNADRHATEARALATDLLRAQSMARDPSLAVALGAGIEVHAQVLAKKGERAEAVAFLRQQLVGFESSPIGERIRKNLNLLDLEGKPAPPLEIRQWMGTQPAPLSSLRGHPVLLFFWAHWCPDCKAMGATISSLINTYGREGLVVWAPTRLYGYVGNGEDAPPALEIRYIEAVRRQFYPMLASVPVPVSTANFLTYGVSTTPTLVMLDSKGVVRYYHPGAASESELSVRIQKILRP